MLDPDGVDVYFLNREPMLNVRSSQELIPIFAVPPEGIYENISFELIIILVQDQHRLFVSCGKSLKKKDRKFETENYCF